MKRFGQLLVLTIALILVSPVFGQSSSGVLWIKSFSPGSADLNDPLLDKKALAVLDSLMQDPEIHVTFLGAADSLAWVFDGQKVHPELSEAWNDAKRLSRARALRERYGRGEIGITHENVAGVKVVWRKGPDALYSEVDRLKRELDLLKGALASDTSRNGHNGHNGHNGQKSENGQSTSTVDGLAFMPRESKFNWRLQAGLWGWQAVSDRSLISPSLALSIIIDRTAFIIQGGVSPWTETTPQGNQANSFVYAGVKYMLNDRWGLSAGGFRGWEFFTSTDSWSFKTTGAALGVVVSLGRFEINPALTVSNIATLEKSGYWRTGMSLGLNFNFN